MLRFAPALALFILIAPILLGLFGTLFPAFGYLPALGGETFSFDAFQRLFARAGIFQSMWLSFSTGILTSLIALSIVACFVAGWSHSRIFKTMQHLVSPLLSIPHAAAAFGLAFLIAPSGWIMRLISPMFTGVTRPPDVLIIHDSLGLVMMFGLIIKEIPFLLLITLAALPQVRAGDYNRVATSMGYGRISGFIYTVWPKLYGQIRLAVFAVIAYASSVVDVAIILGPGNPAPLAVRLIGWMSDPELSFRFEASAGAMLQLGVTLSALLFWLGLEKMAARATAFFRDRGTRFKHDTWLRSISLSGMVITVLIIAIGLVILGIWSVAGFWSFPNALPNALTLKHWMRALPSLKEPFFNAIGIAFISTSLALIITLACLEREARYDKGLKRSTGTKAQSLLYLPLLVPQVGFIFGLQLLFINLGLDATWIALSFVHLIFVLPYVFLSLADPWRAWDTRYGQVAFGLGASHNKMFWRIRLPMLTRAICAAAAVGFAASLGQYLPTILIGAGRISTVTTEAVALASGGNRRLIGVYAFLQMLLPFIGFSIAAIIPAFLYRNRKDLKANT